MNKNAPDPRELLRIHNEQKEECRKEHEEKRLRSNKLTMYIDTIKPEWFRQVIVKAISSGNEVRISMYHDGRKISEYPIQLVDRRHI